MKKINKEQTKSIRAGHMKEYDSIIDLLKSKYKSGDSLESKCSLTKSEILDIEYFIRHEKRMNELLSRR